jgi:regulatory protein
MAAGAGLSLTGRALRLLSQREHSRLELRRKLGTHAESPEQLDRVLDDLERRGFLSEQRFADSVVHRRAGRFGLRLIEHELGAHRVDATIRDPVLARLRGTERERALEVWRKRFGQAPVDVSERARHYRFLVQRGFTAEAVAWVMREGIASSGGTESESGPAATRAANPDDDSAFPGEFEDGGWVPEGSGGPD